MGMHIKNGRVIDPANRIDNVQDIYLANGRVAALGTQPAGFNAEQTIDATGLVVCPGLVDMCARLREPGLEHKATIASESFAAASAGITTLCCPPDTDPIIDTPAVAELIRQRAEQANIVHVVTMGALTKGLAGKQLSEMAALKAAGCVGMSNAMAPIVNTAVMRSALEYAATYNLTVFLYSEDAWLRHNGCMHEGAVSTRLGLPGIPEAAEIVGVTRDLALVEQTGARVHFCRLSTAQAAQLVYRAQKQGLPVSADVAAHQLHLTEIDAGDFNSLCHVIPPLRSQRDMEGLREAVAKGIINSIVSDHQPHELDAKLRPFSETDPGISGLETLLPLSLRLAENKFMSLSDVIARLTCNPAKILGLAAGSLSVGSLADICIFDPEISWQLTQNTFVSRGHNSPFIGWPLKGKVTHTVVAGKLVYSHRVLAS